jgi:hypothetical protein
MVNAFDEEQTLPPQRQVAVDRIESPEESTRMAATGGGQSRKMVALMTRRTWVLMAFLTVVVVTVGGTVLGWWDGWALTVLASIFFLSCVFKGARNSVMPLFGPMAQANQSSPDREDRK